LGADPETQIVYGSTPDELAHYRWAVAGRSSRFSVRAIADQARVSIGTVSTARRGLGNPSRETLAAIDRAVSALAREVGRAADPGSGQGDG
jgi:hypothetical protein